MTMNLAHVDPVSVARFDQTCVQTKKREPIPGFNDINRDR